MRSSAYWPWQFPPDLVGNDRVSLMIRWGLAAQRYLKLEMTWHCVVAEEL